jgi:hypothetical protein
MRSSLRVSPLLAALLFAWLGCSDSSSDTQGGKGGNGVASGSAAMPGGHAGSSEVGASGGANEGGQSGSDSAAGGAAGSNAAGGAAGASAGSGGTGGVSGPDAGAILGGDSKCAQSKFQLCEDFETGTLDMSTWKLQGTAPTIDGDHVARGKKALHIKDASGMSTHLTETKTFREPDNTYYGRMFIYFKSLPAPMASFTYSHWTILAATGDGPGSGGEIRFGGQMQNGVNRWGTGTDNQSPGGTGDWTNIDQDPAPDGMPSHVPTDQWMCIEWMHAGPDTNLTKIWWDGTEHPSIATTKTNLGTKLARANATSGMGDFILPNFTALWIGWQAYQGGGETFELWMDEIAIDHTRIGCAN